MNQFFKPTIQAWSYSRLSTWEECPAKAKYKFLDKLPEPDNPAMARGSDIHKLAENYLKGELTELPVQLQQVDEYIEELMGAQTELQLAFTRKWAPTTWFGPDVYCRVVFDAVKITPPEAVVVDHKTGKQRPEEHKDQLRLYALAAFMKWPEVEVVHSQILYIDHGERMRMMFTRDIVPNLLEYWDERAGKMRADDIFAPRPSPKCKWCTFRKSNGGPCTFG
jgi:CRISPR/Cas system-associated exonuclease Cas4 (RecB family)